MVLVVYTDKALAMRLIATETDVGPGDAHDVEFE
jgi:hypothetical protein